MMMMMIGKKREKEEVEEEGREEEEEEEEEEQEKEDEIRKKNQSIFSELTNSSPRGVQPFLNARLYVQALLLGKFQLDESNTSCMGYKHLKTL
ncbi:hypothetical protein PoB_003767000 [Plakobranchus ocellatus]|uniref:Uncharacterized protein n=1 Tax=Plakobranchus ocellatus TaxID=259542 RepID=A0AAV4AV69_9GAST|nr:hypothetical protein PoB_003767000 [Plakobranchus ocellatus]